MHTTCIWLAYDLQMTCIWLAYDLHMTCKWLANDLHMTEMFQLHLIDMMLQKSWKADGVLLQTLKI